MRVEFDGSELNHLAARIGNATGHVGARTAVAIRKTAADIERDSKVFAPVDTGALRESISTTITGDARFGAIAAEVGPTVDYAVHLEFGTATMAPHAFMGPAYDRHAHTFEAALLQLAAAEI